MKKICVVTGTRAEYGLLKWLMFAIQNDHNLELQLLVTGMHLSPEFGLTYKSIEEDGFIINKKVEILTNSDTPVGISKAMGLGLIGFGEAFSELAPDLLVILGDRFEILSAAAAAIVSQIPIAHLHGGERTEGAFDEAFRHAITKMSHLHFVATEEYRNRVIQLGERPDTVFMVGGLGIDSIKRLKLLKKETLERTLNFKFGNKNLLVTFHPVTLENFTAESQMRELLNVFDSLKDTKIIFTYPNADTHGHKLIRQINDYVETHPNSIAFKNLGQLNYLSCIQFIDGVVGNSSSGLIEVPSFKKGTINIGDRQKGRLQAASVIQCEPEKESIMAGINRLYSKEFQNSLSNVENFYGNGGATEKIFDVIKNISTDKIMKKAFYDLL